MTALIYEAIPAPQAGSPEWLAMRRKGIGGSDAAAVCGLSKYATMLDVYMDKVGLALADKETTRAMRKGNAIEPFLKSEYELETGYRGYKPEMMLRSIEAPWMLINPDWLGAEGIEHGAEFKSSDAPMLWGEVGTEDVPDDYWVQVQVYMFVTGRPLWHIYVLLPHNEMRLYAIPADKEAQRDIVDRCGHFWTNYVLKGIAPDFDAGSVSDPLKAVRRAYGAVNDAVVELAPAVALLCEQYEKASEQASSSKKEADRLKAQLLGMVGDAGKGIVPNGWEITRKISPRKGYWVDPSESIRTTIKRLEAA